MQKMPRFRAIFAYTVKRTQDKLGHVVTLLEKNNNDLFHL